MSAIEGYANKVSVLPGEDIGFCLHADPTAFTVEVIRMGATEKVFHSAQGNAPITRMPPHAFSTGCAWPAAHTVTVGSDWPSGAYFARFTTTEGDRFDILFVVRSAAPGRDNRILLQLTTNTYQAYNSSGGCSLYDNGPGQPPSQRVSYNRPVSVDMFCRFELPFIVWAEQSGFGMDYASNWDLHAYPDLLTPYRLALSVGHDEYWSREMRENAEAFIANGGNMAFFSGNSVYWQVRLEGDDRRTLVCYRTTAADPDGALGPRNCTVTFRDAGWPENSFTGVSFYHGAGWWNPAAGPKPEIGYTVRAGDHWVFEHTDLANGDVFGEDAPSIHGYESDSAPIDLDAPGRPLLTDINGSPLFNTPRNLVVLADADLRSLAPGGTGGAATMVIYRNNGTVFNAATTDWVYHLTGPGNPVHQITFNVLSRLSQAGNPASWKIENAGFERWTNNSPDGWIVEGTATISDGGPGAGGSHSLLIDATAGAGWVSQGPQLVEGASHYRIGCWAKCDRAGASIRLQSTESFKDFIVATHSGNGTWEYLSAAGALEGEGMLAAARVKCQVDDGAVAQFDNVTVEAI